MDYYRASEHRGTVDIGWLKSKHSFSFGHYYDPKHMGVSVLRVINDDTVMPGAGFDTHSHRDMEIISYVLKGKIEHKDSMGNHFQIPAGEVQRMSAGSGITHSEYNASSNDTLHFLQIWIKPNVMGSKPGYEQKSIPQTDKLTPLVTPDGANGTLSIQQDASIYRLRLKQGDSIALSTKGRTGYLHLIEGSLKTGAGQLVAGDAMAISNQSQWRVTAESQLEALWFDLPQS